MQTNRSGSAKLCGALTVGMSLWMSACAPVGEDGELLVENEDNVGSIEQALLATNGLKSVNGLSSTNGLDAMNGLKSVNGLSSTNGLKSVNGLQSGVGLMTSDGGRETIKYLVRCALPTGQSVTKKDQNGKSYTFNGQIGVAPEWADGACNKDCQESVSACLLAHVNTTGQNISLWLDGNMPGVGWGQSTGHPYEEGSFFGNLFSSPPTMFYCNGKDFDQGVVPGRIGANQANAPYTYAWAEAKVCKSFCTEADIPNQHDGYKACGGLNHVITVWRNFDPNTSYKICNRASGKCLDSTATTESLEMVQNTYRGTTGQKWQILQVSPKQYKVINKLSGKALSVFQKKTTNGTSIVQTAFTSGATEKLWSFTSMGDASGFHAISPVLSSTSVLALPNATTKDAQVVQEWAWTSATHQQWSITIAN